MAFTINRLALKQSLAQEDCVNLQLSSGDLDRLETAIRVGAVGRKHVADDLAFVAEARDCLARGLAVYYTSWW